MQHACSAAAKRMQGEGAAKQAQRSARAHRLRVGWEHSAPVVTAPLAGPRPPALLALYRAPAPLEKPAAIMEAPTVAETSPSAAMLSPQSDPVLLSHLGGTACRAQRVGAIGGRA